MVDLVQQRQEKVFHFLKQHQSWLIYFILAVIVLLAFFNRIAPMPNLKDVTTGDYIPIEIDSFAFLRYAEELQVNGTLAAVDTFRYYPEGYPNEGEFTLLAWFVVYLYRFLHFFSPSTTLALADVLYPPIAFAISLIFFFLLLRRLFDYRVALLATAYLAFIPTYVQRTIAGFADKESLAMLFFFIAFYFFVVSYQQEQRVRVIAFSILSGLFTALLGKVWGGVRFLFLIIGIYVLIEILFNRLTNNHSSAYVSWSLTSLISIMLIYGDRYTWKTMITSINSGILLFVLACVLVYILLQRYDLLKLKSRFHNHLPIGLISVIIVTLFGFIFGTLLLGPSYIFNLFNGDLSFITAPFAENRWALTVAESHQPYIRDFISQLGRFFFVFFLAGTIILFYQFIKPLHENRKKLTAFFALFVLAFTLNRYAPNSVFNGDNTLSLLLFFGSFILFFATIFLASLHVYRRRREHYQEFLRLNGMYLLVLVWFFITIVGARSMVRLIVVLSPIVCLLASYALVSLYDYAMQQRHRLYRIALIAGLLCILLLPNIQGSLTSYYKTTSQITKNSGPIYTQQWQQAMAWVRDNTPANAVFAHWWDYGYWVQTGGKRATVSDGGNNGGPGINYNNARYLLTSPDDTQTLSYLKSRGVTHVLIISEEIGKYPAFSSIGSDLNNDRYSWLNVLSLDQRLTQEQRNQTIYAYTGGSYLDADFLYNDHLFTRLSAAVVAVLLPFSPLDNSSATISQPSAVLLHNNQQYTVPVGCIIFQNKRLEFPGPSLPSCVLIIPSIEGNRMNPIGALIHLSEKTKDSFLARYYLYGDESPNFKLVYSDEKQVPLALYNGRMIGPHKIWEVNYPPNLYVNESYGSRFLPDSQLTYVPQI